ncbi:uncharacterized protein [Miscanthus floridulus]|uniref:uncharacterized protein isoform X4 n=1 Tax=Miscanthus floridulus TaxID=154761 RepID=UPI003459A9F6
MPPPGPRLPPLLLLLLLAAACSSGLTGAGEGGSCEFSVERGGELYSFALEAPTPAHRHGVLSEDGFYKVAVNDSILWFQDCGGPSRCGTQCSALVSNYIRGYDVCTTIGSLSKSHISLVDESNPQKGIIVKMFSSKCSISVSVLCESTAAQVPDKFVVSGLCDYATTLKHPSGCARSVSASGSGWGWLSTSFMTILCLLGGYILIGAVYRYYFLGIHSVEAIPNLEFWIGLPQRIKTIFVPATRSHVSYNRDGQGTYAPVYH